MPEKTLSNWLPHEARDYPELAGLLQCPVLLDFDGRVVPWIGKHKNVLNWCVVQYHGKRRAVGWNENPAVGWSFPVMHVNETLYGNLANSPQSNLAGFIGRRIVEAASPPPTSTQHDDSGSCL